MMMMNRSSVVDLTRLYADIHWILDTPGEDAKVRRLNNVYALLCDPAI